MHTTYAETPDPSVLGNPVSPGRKLAAERTLLGYINQIRKFRSVVDFGCGIGNWLRVARELGATEIRGYDSPGIPLAARGLTGAEFHCADLAQTITTEKVFDLAICLEIAQWLAPGAASRLVKSLCSAADWVLFSAAVPFQGGADHVNENWMEYWAALFCGNGFLCYDILREEVWNDREIPFYYRQNVCLYVRRGADDALTSLGREPSAQVPSLIHPELYLKLVNWLANNPTATTDSRVFESDARTYYRGVQLLMDGESAIITAPASVSQ
jgi:hypothetical protein